MIAKQKGTYDLFGDESRKVLALRNIFEELMSTYNYSFIRTPIFEASELFHRTVGETSDIVSKETYDFKDRGDRNITLRPEGTAAVARSFIENKMYTDGILPKKFWYYGPMFRYERPQSGRYREHYQFGCEAYGSNDPMMDAEVISVPVTLFSILGLNGVKVMINTLGDDESRENYRKALIDYLKPHIDELCEDCKVRFEKNPLRILDCKVDGNSEILKNVPRTIDYLNEESDKYFNDVLKYLDALDIAYEVDPTTIRGLDYYTHTVFEIVADIKDMGSQSVLCGGGRYNNLVERLDGPSIPAVGFGLGSERLLLALEHEGIDISENNMIDAYVIPTSSNEKEFACSFVYTLRSIGLKVEIDYLNRTVKSNFKQAERLNSKFTIVIGDEEIKNNYFTVKDMKNREEEKVEKSNIIKYLMEKLESEDECSCDDECNCEDDCSGECNDNHECHCHEKN